MNASIEPQRQAIDRRGAFAGIAVRSAVALLARRRLGMEGGTRLADPGDYLLAQCRVRPAMPVGGRINREQERVSAGPGHRAVERRLDRTDQLLELRAGPDMIGEGLRSDEHTSELQLLMRLSSAVF